MAVKNPIGERMQASYHPRIRKVSLRVCGPASFLPCPHHIGVNFTEEFWRVVSVRGLKN